MEHNMENEFLTRQLKEKRIRPSYQRMRILDYLATHHTHPTADTIYQALKQEIPALSKSTVYNTLITFANAGLVQSVRIDEPGVRFDIKTKQHGHFRCQACDRLIDFDINLDEVNIQGLEQHHITERHVYYQGLCQACLTESNKEEF